MINIKLILKFLFYISISSSSLLILKDIESTRIYVNVIKILPILISYIILFQTDISIKKSLIIPSLSIVFICLSRFFIPDIQTSIIESYGLLIKDTNEVNILIFNQIIFILILPIMYYISPTLNEKKKAYITWVILSILISISTIFYRDLLTSIHNKDWGLTSGLVGNPNSFGLLNYLIILDILSWQSIPRLFIFIIPILLILGFITGSLMCLLFGVIVIIYIFYYLLVKRNLIYKLINLNINLFTNLFLISILLILISFNFEYFLSITKTEFLYQKLDALLSFKGSLSVDLRKDFYNYAFLLISRNPLCLITGFCGNKYLVGDGYIVTLLASFGLPISFIYLWSYIKIFKIFRSNNGYLSYISKKKNSYFFSPYSLSICLMLLSLVTNRLVDYWPFMPISLYILSGATRYQLKQANGFNNTIVEDSKKS